MDSADEPIKCDGPNCKAVECLRLPNGIVVCAVCGKDHGSLIPTPDMEGLSDDR